MARKKKNAGVVPLTSPVTREEHYLANIAGLVENKPEYPFTRTERYLDAISGSTSGLSDRVTALEIGKLDIVGMGANLLDNSYFIGSGTPGEFPINQFGATGANAYTSNGRTIDRWLQSGACITGWENGIFTVKLPGYNSSFRQYLNASALTEGEHYTVSVVSATGLHSFTFIASKLNTAQSDAYENGLYFYVGWASDISKWVISLATNGAESSELVLFQPKVAKLELGTKQTVARKVGDNWVLNAPPASYQQELAKCERHLEKIEFYGDIRTDSSGVFNIPMFYHTKKASAPTITILQAEYYDGSNWISIPYNDPNTFSTLDMCAIRGYDIPANAELLVSIRLLSSCE